MAKQSETVGYDQESKELNENSLQLFNAAKAFERKFIEIKENPKDYKEAISPKPIKKRPNSAKPGKKQLSMINNLARERFGSPSETTPKKENSRIKNKDFHEKNTDKKPTNIIEEAGHLINFTEKSDHANSTLMDGLVSLGHDHHFANINVNDNELEKSEATSKNRELESKNSNLSFSTNNSRSNNKKAVSKKVEKYGSGSLEDMGIKSRISPIFENVLNKSDGRFYMLGHQKGLTVLGTYLLALFSLRNREINLLQQYFTSFFGWKNS